MRSCFSYFLYVFTCVVIVVFVTNEIKEGRKKKTNKNKNKNKKTGATQAERYVAAELNVNIHCTLDYIAKLTLYIFADQETITIR